MRSQQDTTAAGLSVGNVDHDWPAVVASAVCLVFSVGTITVYSFGVFVRPLANEFHWNRLQLTGAVAAGQYAFALSSVLWGALIDRFGPRATILPAIVALSVSICSLAWLTPRLWHLYLIFSLIPLLAGAASPLGYGAVMIRKFNHHLGLALGLALMGVGLGGALLPPLAQALIQAVGWRHGYFTLGCMALLITFPAAVFATRNLRKPLEGARQEAPPVFSMVVTREFFVICGIFLLLGIASVGTLSQLVPMMVDRGFTPAAAARIAGLTGLATIASRGTIGWLVDRFHAPNVVGIVSLCGTASCVLLGFGSGRISSYAAALLLGTVIGAEVDFVAFLVRRYFPPAAFGRLYGVAFGLFVLGSGTGPLVLARCFDRFHSYQSGLIFFALVTLVAAMLTQAMPAYKRGLVAA